MDPTVNRFRRSGLFRRAHSASPQSNSSSQFASGRSPMESKRRVLASWCVPADHVLSCMAERPEYVGALDSFTVCISFRQSFGGVSLPPAQLYSRFGRVYLFFGTTAFSMQAAHCAIRRHHSSRPIPSFALAQRKQVGPAVNGQEESMDMLLQRRYPDPKAAGSGIRALVNTVGFTDTGPW